MTTPVGVDSILSQIRQMRQMTQIAQPQPLPPVAPAAPSTPVEGPARAGFSQMLQESVETVNALQQTGRAKVTAFELGENISLTEVMVSLQKADVSFKALVEVRNKFIDAYQEIMRMSV